MVVSRDVVVSDVAVRERENYRAIILFAGGVEDAGRLRCEGWMGRTDRRGDRKSTVLQGK